MKDKRGKRIYSILMVVILNIALFICVIFSVLSAFNNSEKVSFSQNIENVRTLTNASANKIELELANRTKELESVSGYINTYHSTGMNFDEIHSYLSALYASEGNFSWQLINNTLENEGKNNAGFSAIGLCSESDEQFFYRVDSYPELAKIFGVAGEDNVGIVHYTGEFTDSSPSHKKSSAITTTVRVRTEDGYEYKTMMYLLESDYINELIANNNDIDTWNFFDYSNIIIDNSGNYVISNSYFQGTNFMDYISLYNDFTSDEADILLEKLKQEDYHEVLYYQNNRGQDCAYTIVPVQNSEWHILSIVPLSSFHNTYDFSNDFLKFAIVLIALFIVDGIALLMGNSKLRHLTKRAKEASESKSLFLSSMSHDIRTPLNAIIGTTVIAEKQLEETKIDREAVKESIRMIELSGTHLLTLINDILDVSKIESGKIVLQPSEFSIVDIVERMVEMCQPKVQEKNFVFETHIENVSHAYIKSDALRLNQIFINILSNALKYTEPGGKILVELSEEPTPGKPECARYIYKVSDTGIGMSPEFVDTVFERFTRAVDTRINSVQGTGLGMAIVKQLVTILGGTIQVESELNVGSVFTVTLDFPIAQTPVEFKSDDNKKVEGVEYFPDLKILVVEDNNINWKVLDKILNYYGVKAERAENGKIAVDKVQNSEFVYDLILMDIQMPVMNGLEATKIIRGLQDKKKASMAIYAMTADAFTEDIQRCLEAGMNGHLAKPIEVDKLLVLFRELAK
ncbi:MAG: ATP-binding protein [Lachnospiraceae bacterium]|nr:ATP-binding protein [Lachnospiraceae bacterium]